MAHVRRHACCVEQPLRDFLDDAFPLLDDVIPFLSDEFQQDTLHIAGRACDFVGVAHANLVANGGFETGDLTSWGTDTAGSGSAFVSAMGSATAESGVRSLRQFISSTTRYFRISPRRLARPTMFPFGC